METLLVGIVGLIISYYIIIGAVKSAIKETLAKHLSIQTGYLKFLAKQAGMTTDENNRIVLSDKEYKKLNEEVKIKM